MAVLVDSDVRPSEAPPQPAAEAPPRPVAVDPASHPDADRPLRLLDGVELLGEFRDSGYRTPKFLLRRPDGQVMQLPRLLYRVAASLDGRTARQIAEVLSVELADELDEPLTADQVTYLVEERLRPVGVIAAQDDGPPDALSPVMSDPLLALRYRVGVLDESISWRIAGIFRGMFARPVWMLALAVFVAVDVLIVVQGDLIDRLIAGATQMIRQPSLNLLVIGLLLVSLMFHECGHVAACRYGGARPGNMGFGLYIVWPALYSTVTDSYRLDRTGRLRTDLGGVYFNAVFIAGAGALYLRTREPWLLVAVLALHTETAWQFLPTIRFDGYYMLSDLAGVPELFSYVGPVMKSALPGRPTHPKVAQLRPWSRRLIVVWVGLTVPVILGWLCLILLVLPRAVPKLVAAVGEYLDTVRTAMADGSVASVALSVFQLGMLILPWLGSALITLMVTRMLRGVAAGRWGWTWAIPNPARGRVVRHWAALGAAIAFGALLVQRVAWAIEKAPSAAAEERIVGSALGVVELGRSAAPGVPAGELAVREQLVAWDAVTGAFDRHAAVLTGARELAVLAVAVLVVCALVVARAMRWPWVAVALPLAALAAAGPAVAALATVGPGLLGAAWAAAGATTLVLAGHPHGRHRPSRGRRLRRRALLVGSGLTLVVAVATAPGLVGSLAVGGALLLLRGSGRTTPARWAVLVLAALAAVGLAVAVLPALLRSPGMLPVGEAPREVLLVLTGLVVAGAAAVPALRGAAAVVAALLVLAVLPAPGADAVLPLLVCGAAGLGAALTAAMLREPAEHRPHPLLRAGLVLPVLVLVVVGALFPVRDADQRGTAGLTDPAPVVGAPGPVLPGDVAGGAGVQAPTVAGPG